MIPHAKLYISLGKTKGVFGDGKWELLKEIDKEGSIQQAAKNLNRCYRKAWGDIKSAEDRLKKKIVMKSRGGKTGGSTVLTEFGTKLLKQWEEYKIAVQKDMQKSFKKHLQKLCEPEYNNTSNRKPPSTQNKKG